ncbi:MAG TPA: hypothetical protein VK988_11145 [Acidimicrobiales bacterium]|nr:hypothetical protein [Acidimicrobiales bacterium]
MTARFLMAAAAMAAVSLTSGPAWAQGDPPGNNGTIKLDDITLDDDTDPNNEPHVGCSFGLDFYGFDEGDLVAEVTFEAQPPTGGGVLLQDSISIGGDPAGGGTDLDASRSYDLSDALAAFSPHPQQGYHVKLTVNAQGSQGADTKHKVFWTQRCDAYAGAAPAAVSGQGLSQTPDVQARDSSAATLDDRQRLASETGGSDSGLPITGTDLAGLGLIAAGIGGAWWLLGRRRHSPGT